MMSSPFRIVSVSVAKSALSICILVLIGLAPSSSFSDEVILDDQQNLEFDMGDFRCSPCKTRVSNAIDLLKVLNGDGNSTREVTAGELWMFFDAQGVDSLDRLTVCLDIDKIDRSSVFDLQSLELKIEDPSKQGALLTNVSFGGDSLLVPGYETSSFKPEAKMEILLGYDFMQRFSADSTEMVQLDFSSNSGLASNAKLSIEGKQEEGGKFNIFLLLGFVGFWVLVFYVLNRITKPSNTVTPKTKPASTQRTKQAVSV